jgi:hypothetical protein
MPSDPHDIVSKPVSKSASHILTNATKCETNNMPMEIQDKKQRLLKAKIAVALQNEFGRVPTEEEIDHVYHLTRVMWKAVLGLHYKRRQQKKSGQLTIF